MKTPDSASSASEPDATPLLWAFPRQPRLLVVDDQVLHIQLLHHSLPAGCQVFMATNGLQAVRLADERQADLILLDVEMPGMDGFATLQQLRGNPATRHIPVIFITAHTGAEMEAKALEAGAVDYISKPINPAVVRARVHTHLQLKFQSDFLRQWVYIDGLTAIHNRRHFDEQLAIEWARSQRHNQPLCLVLFDVDHFKAYNDHYGHLQGDQALRNVASAARAALLRPGDLLCRYGGEEFACLLPATTLSDAAQVAERIRLGVQGLQLPHLLNQPSHILTISLGVAANTACASPEEFVAQADRQLYRAKHDGKNRVAHPE